MGGQAGLGDDAHFKFLSYTALGPDRNRFPVLPLVGGLLNFKRSSYLPEQSIHNCAKSFNALNFELVECTDAKGEKRPLYLLSPSPRSSEKRRAYLPSRLRAAFSCPQYPVLRQYRLFVRDEHEKNHPCPCPDRSTGYSPRCWQYDQ